MKALKVLAVVAVFGCYVFGTVGAGAAMISICPVGGGACSVMPTPASSYSTALSIDVTPRLPVVDPMGSAGSFCGSLMFDSGIASGEGSRAASSQMVPCQGFQLTPISQGNAPYAVNCPAGYESVQTGLTGNSGGGSTNVWFSCLKL